MAISAQCPHCLAKLKLKNPELVGKKVRCPGCQEPFTVAASPAAPAAGTPAKAKTESPAAGEDDWLAGIDSLDENAADQTSRATAPPIVGKKKRKKVSTSARPEKSSRWRDEDGEFPLAAHRLLMMATGLLGGLIGILIWGGIIYMTGYEVGYVAILVGFLAGTGVRLGASKFDFGWWPAITAVVIAVLTITGGKLVGANMLLSSMVGDIQEVIHIEMDAAVLTHENMLISDIADEISFEWEDQGRELAWPEDYNEEWDYDPEHVSKTYPPDVWAEAAARWQKLTDAEKQQRRDELKEFAEQMASLESPGISIGLSEAGWLFGPIDILWIALACSGAFKIAAGWEDD